MARLALFVTLLSVVGCGDDAGDLDAAVDTGADAGTDAVVVIAPMPPASPTPPVLTPCPTGWRTVTTSDEVDVCQPWPEAGRDMGCASYEAHMPGAPGCTRIGSACPPDGLPEGVDPSALFVSAGAVSGDGTRASPFGTIAEALAAVGAGGVIAVGVGTYDEPIRYGDGISVQGACTEGTILVSSAPSSTAGVVTAAPGGTSLANLTIGPSQRPGIWGTTASAAFTVRDVVIDQPRWVGVNLEAGAELDAEGFVVRNVVPGDGGLFGRGLTIERGASARVVGGFIEGASEFAVLSLGEDTTVDLERMAILDTSPRVAGDLAGSALTATDGGRITAREVVIEEATDVAVVALRGSIIEMEDSVIRGTRSHPVTIDHGRAFDAEQDSHFVARRCLLEANREYAILVGGATMELFDVVVRDTLPREVDGRFGRAISAQFGGTLTGERIWLVDNREAAVLAGKPGTRVELSDVLIARTGPDDRGALGHGVVAQEGAELTLRRAAIVENTQLGVFCTTGGARVVLEDVEIRGTRPTSLVGNLGRAVLVQFGATLTARRAHVTDHRDVALCVIDADLVLEDTVISGVQPAECAETTCSSTPGGHGVGVYRGGTVDARRFQVEGAALCGLHLAEEGTAALDDGRINQNTIGVCLQNERQDLAALDRNVRYEDNGLRLDATMLPVPGSVDEIADAE